MFFSQIPTLFSLTSSTPLLKHHLIRETLPATLERTLPQPCSTSLSHPSDPDDLFYIEFITTCHKVYLYERFFYCQLLPTKIEALWTSLAHCYNISPDPLSGQISIFDEWEWMINRKSSRTRVSNPWAMDHGLLGIRPHSRRWAVGKQANFLRIYSCSPLLALLPELYLLSNHQQH